MVQFDEARKLMDEMMKVTIFQPSDKRRILEDDRKKSFLDPNLIMDARHKIFRENLARSSAKSSVLSGARKLLMQEQTKELQLKRERTLIERELRKFEQDLQKSRPKFCGLCNRKNIASSDDENFWRTSGKVKRILINKRDKTIRHKATFIKKNTKEAFVEVPTAESRDTGQRYVNEVEDKSFSNIKVTIKDKPSGESEENRLRTLKSYFGALRENALNKRRLREIKINIQDLASRRNLRSCIRVWRTHVEKAKIRRQHTADNTDIRKIETFVDVIAETQESIKCRKAGSKGSLSNARDDDVTKKRTPSKPFVVEPPAQSRLSAQKEIIRKQRMKLAEQSKIIDELKLKQVQEEITRSGEETLNVARETLTHCGRQTRRTLIQLMRQAGYRDKFLTAPIRVSSPPRFLVRMEARAEARRSRVKLREEARRRKLEDERRKEEATRREEEQERRRSQQEALREARRMREEQEQQRAREIERCKRSNATAEAFYRRYLLRHYIMEPFIALVEMKNNYMNKAENHYKHCLLRKAFGSWKTVTEYQNQIKIDLALSIYNRNLLWYAMQEWREMVKEERRKEQVARDFSDMKLESQYFKLWKIKTVEYKTERLKSERLALEHYEKRLKIRHFNMWKRYPRIASDIAESERIRNTWREIVQEIIPDFDPKQRGVMLED